MLSAQRPELHNPFLIGAPSGHNDAKALDRAQIRSGGLQTGIGCFGARNAVSQQDRPVSVQLPEF